jgi:cytochrome b
MPVVAEPRLRTVRVWDLPTRLFHWLLTACVVGSFVSAKIGGAAMVWHLRLGYAVATLLLFRLVWGFVGGRWSRFGHFVRSPATVLRYLRGDARAGDWFDVGHNPLGALSVLAMLGFLAAQVASGLFADDEIATTGPLIRFVSGATSLQLTWYHKAVGEAALLVLVVLHLLAIGYYTWRGSSLVRPMIGGDLTIDAARDVPAAADGAGPRLLAAALVAACAGGVAWLVSLGG